MELILTEPTRLYLKDIPFNSLNTIKSYLTYTNRSSSFTYEKFKKNKWYATSNGLQAYRNKLEELKADIKVCLLNKDPENGMYYTYPGLKDVVEQLIPKTTYINQVTYPDPKLVPWESLPPKLRPYQEETVSLLLNNKHAAVELATGLGKSLIILYLCKALSLKTIIITPSVNIAEQIHQLFLKHLGPKYVGLFGNGKKQTDKLFTIGIAASLTKLREGTKPWAELSKVQVLAVDEAHTIPAATFESIALGLCRKAPYRFFVSGTQARGDGSDMRLKGLIGPIVKRLNVKDGVDLGVLAKPLFRAYRTSSDTYYNHTDANEMTRKHYYYNSNINKMTGAIANSAVEDNKPVLILIEEIEQFIHILPYLKHKCVFAHGGLTDDHKKIVPKEYQYVDNSKLIDDFNNKKVPILIGTSAVATGTDFKVPQVLVLLQGGKSFVGISQAVGRTTRLAEDKVDCIVYDFLVDNVDIVRRHFWERKTIYESIYPDFKVLE